MVSEMTRNELCTDLAGELHNLSDEKLRQIAELLGFETTFKTYGIVEVTLKEMK